MPKLFKTVAICENAHTLLKANASHLGLTIAEVIFMAAGAFDKANGLAGHRAMVEKARAIRVKMREKASRGEAVRPVAAKRRRGHGKGGRYYDHSKWDFASLTVEGPPLVIAEGLHHGARIAACRYRDQNRGWAFTMVPRGKAYHLIRTA